MVFLRARSALFEHPYRGVSLFLILFAAGGFAGASVADEEGGSEKTKAHAADVAKLKCDELQPLARVAQRRYRILREISKRSQIRKAGDLEQLEKMSHELETETLEVAKKVFGELKVLKEAGEASTALSEALKLEAAVEAAEEGAKRITLLKGLHRASKVAAIATNPYIVLGIFVVDQGVEVYEAIKSAANLRDWNKASETLSARLRHAEDKVGNKLAKILVALETKKCPTEELNGGACFGKACGKAIIAEEDHLDSNSRFYRHLCRKFSNSRDFSAALTDTCKSEVAQMIERIGFKDDTEEYAPFERTRRFLKENSRAIRNRCEYEACKACAGKNRRLIERASFLNPISEKEFQRRLQEEQKKYTSNLNYCVGEFGPKAKRLDPGLGVSRYDGPRVDYSNHDGSGRQKWPSRALTPSEWRKAEAEHAARKTIAQAARDRADYKAPKPPKVPDGVKLSCECVTVCTNSTTQPVPEKKRWKHGPVLVSSSLGELAYWYSSEPRAVADCKNVYVDKNKETGPGCRTNNASVVCDWRRSDEALARDQKCEWSIRGEKAVPILSGDAIDAGRADEFPPFLSVKRLSRLLRVLAACKKAKVKASLCFTFKTVHHGGYRAECLNTDGKTELRSQDFHTYKFSEPDVEFSRGDKGKYNPLAGAGFVDRDDGARTKGTH